MRNVSYSEGGVLRAECNEFLVTNVVKIISPRFFFSCQLTNGNMCVNVRASVHRHGGEGWWCRGAGAEQTCGMLLFYIIADMSQRRCLFPTPHLFDQCLQYCTWQEKLRQKHTEGCQLEEFTDPHFFAFPVSALDTVVSAPQAKDQISALGKIKTHASVFFPYDKAVM